LEADHAADEIKHDEEHEHAENGDGADPAQRHLMEVTPIAAGRLLDRASLLVGDGATAGNAVELVEELVFSDRARRRVDRAVGIALLRAGRSRNGDDQRERHRANDETQTSGKFRHLCTSLHWAAKPSPAPTTRWSRDKPSSSPKRRSRSRA